MPHDPFILTLADGTRLALRAGDETAAPIVAFLAQTAQLSPAPPPLLPSVRRLLAVTGVGQDDTQSVPPADADADVICVLEPTDVQRPRRRQSGEVGFLLTLEPITEEQWFWQQLMRLSACIARETLPRGGVLLHSGLALLPPLLPYERGRRGDRGDEGAILLAGRSGVGKSTASMRLPPPWRSLADDVTLVVRDERGTYWAHPWPTWSRFFGEEAGDGSDTWDVQQAVPLRAIFVLEQGEEDRAEPMGPGRAVSLLAELARQASRYLQLGMPLEEIAAFNLQRFDNLCALVRAVPAYLLHVRRHGAFWGEIQRVTQEPCP